MEETCNNEKLSLMVLSNVFTNELRIMECLRGKQKPNTMAVDFIQTVTF